MRHILCAGSLLAIFLAACGSKAGNEALVGSSVGVGGQKVSLLDVVDRENLQKESPRTLKKIDSRERLSIDDVKKMCKAGLSDHAIIGQLQATCTIFFLSTADIIDLKNSGVSQRIVDAMIQAGNQS